MTSLDITYGEWHIRRLMDLDNERMQKERDHVAQFETVEPETWYRYREYVEANWDHEHDRPAGPGTVRIQLLKYRTVKLTRKGLWIAPLFGEVVREEHRRFIRRGAKRRFAAPTPREAREDFLARKRRQIRIMKVRIDRARRAMQIVELEPTPD